MAKVIRFYEASLVNDAQGHFVVYQVDQRYPVTFDRILWPRVQCMLLQKPLETAADMDALYG